jgi:hypothetical protein
MRSFCAIRIVMASLVAASLIAHLVSDYGSLIGKIGGKCRDFTIEGEMSRVDQPVRVEDAVQVIDFMLQDAREEAERFALDAPSHRVMSGERDTSIPRDETAQARDRKAALEGLIRPAIQRRQIGIDQDERLRRPIDNVVIAWHMRQDDAIARIDLGCGEAQATGIGKCLKHVRDQSSDRGRGRVVYGLGHA